MCDSGDKHFLSLSNSAVQFQMHGQTYGLNNPKNLLLNHGLNLPITNDLHPINPNNEILNRGLNLPQNHKIDLHLSNSKEEPDFFSEPMFILFLRSLKDVTSRYKNMGKIGNTGKIGVQPKLAFEEICSGVAQNYGNNILQYYGNLLWQKINLGGWANDNQKSLMDWAKRKNIKTLIIGGEVLVAATIAFSLSYLEEKESIYSPSNKNKVIFDKYGRFDIPKISIPIKVSRNVDLNLIYDSKREGKKRIYQAEVKFKMRL